MTYKLASHLDSNPRKMPTSSAGLVPAAFDTPVRTQLGSPSQLGFIGDAPVRVCGVSHRHGTSSAAVSLGLRGLLANERRCNGLTFVGRPEMEGTDESK